MFFRSTCVFSYRENDDDSSTTIHKFVATIDADSDDEWTKKTNDEIHSTFSRSQNVTRIRAMASTRKSVTAMDILKSDYEYISTYSKKIDELLRRTNNRNLSLLSISFLSLNRWWFSSRSRHWNLRQSWQRKIESMVNWTIDRFSSVFRDANSFFSTQLCISAQMKFSVSSENIGHVVYIDTEGSFVPTRLRTMAMSADDHYRNIDRTTITNQQIEDILKNVTYFRCVNIAELLACLVQLKSILSKDRNVRLIILDSLAHPIRSLSTNSHLVRHKYIIRIVNLLQKLAKDLNCAVSRIRSWKMQLSFSFST